MNIPRLLFILVLALSPQFVLAEDVKAGKQLYKTHCEVCHGVSGGMDMKKRIAPPIAGVRRHYLASHPDKDSFVMVITDWVNKPEAGKSLMPGAVRRFDIMPPLSLAREDVEKIASYIYEGDIEKPAGFDEHVEKMHGSKSPGQVSR